VSNGVIFITEVESTDVADFLDLDSAGLCLQEKNKDDKKTKAIILESMG
jgi:hypothetical protein